MDRERVVVVVAGALGIVALAAATVGVMGPSLFVLLGAGGLGLLLWRGRRRPVTADQAWTGAAAWEISAAGPMASPPTRRMAPKGSSVAWSLSRLEAGHLASTGWFGIGVGFWLILILVFGVLWPEEAYWSRWEMAALMVAFAHPFVGCWLVAVHRGMSRPHRDGSEELFASCPAAPEVRTAAFVMTAWLAVVVTWVAAGAVLVLVSLRNPNLFGPWGGRAVVELTVMTILPIGATVLGTALGRWAPWRLVPILAVLGVAGTSFVLSGLGPSSYETERALVSWVYSGPFNVVFLHPPVWERLAWLGGLSVVVACIAFLADVRSRRVVVPLVLGAVFAVVAAGSLLRPLSAREGAALAAPIADPAAHQDCRSAGGDVMVCAYRPYVDLAGLMAEEIAPVVAALPPGVGSVTFRQRFDGSVAELPEVVRRNIPEPGDEGDEGDEPLYFGFASHHDALRAGRFRLAAHAIGLGTDPVDPGTSVSGQARGVVVLWLATRGWSPSQIDQALTPELHGDGEFSATQRGDIWPGRCNDEVATVVWSPQDLAAARVLVRLDDDVVRRVVWSQWDRWSDPGTGTDELLAAVGLGPVGPAEPVDPGGAERCV